MEDNPRRVLIALWAAAAIIAVGLLHSCVEEARAHDAPATIAQPHGWSYGFECCSLKDCWQEPSSAIRETPAGYLVVGTGEVIPYQDRRVKRSRDEFYHRCAQAGNRKWTNSICLYAPDRSF